MKSNSDLSKPSTTWRRSEEPLLSMRGGAFDACHIHAPEVVVDGGQYRMWYSGSDRTKNEYHRIGYAESVDGIHWTRRDEPVIVPPSPTGYYTTPSLLRDRNGLRREDDKLRMWVTGHNLMNDLYHFTSEEGIVWQGSHHPLPFSAYAPSVCHHKGQYVMFYTALVDGGPMAIFRAVSSDGLDWSKDPASPVLRTTESWEAPNLLYPFVHITHDESLALYYTSYDPSRDTCEIACARSADGLLWYKPAAPVISPNPMSAWDSIYCSAACLVPGDERDPVDRLYYAGRIDMKHKYYAIGVAQRNR